MNFKKLINSNAVDKAVDGFTDNVKSNIGKIADEIDKDAPRFAEKVTKEQIATAKFKELKCSFCGVLGSEVKFRQTFPYHKKCLRFVLKQSILKSPKAVGRF